VEAGGLLSYSANLPDLYARAAGYVDKNIDGHKAERPACATADQIRAGNQREDRQDT
jgi:hypothetical protein